MIKNVCCKRVVLITIMLFAVSFVKAQTISTQIMVDQFGYRPSAIKCVVFANPQAGQNSYRSGYNPGAYFLVKRVSDNSTAFSNAVQIWNGGAIFSNSMDYAWWGYFTPLNTTGTYYIQDANGKRSFNFSIKPDVYKDILKQTSKMYYYSRCGTVSAAYVSATWSHAACHVGDYNAQARSNGTALANWPIKDVHGGWHDAGDYNKYIATDLGAVWDLLMAYELNPSAFKDNVGIPESGNGVPDILDEAKFEIDWMLRMQMTNRTGNTQHLWGVCNRVAAASTSVEPDLDLATRYYTYPTSWATSIFAGVLAHAARTYQGFSGVFGNYSQILLQAATNAWKFLQIKTNMYPSVGNDWNCGFGAACAGSDPTSDAQLRMFAAAELYKTTGFTQYKNYYDTKYVVPNPNTFVPAPGTLPMAHIMYATSPGADPVKVTAIKSAFQTAMTWWWLPNTNASPYRSYVFNYFWGATAYVGSWSKWLTIANWLNVSSGYTNRYRSMAEEYIHWFHGVNALNWVYITKATNATKSVNLLWHSWYGDAGLNNPPPGFLPGGPNGSYANDTANSGGTARYPPAGQPGMKSYWDWDKTWPDCSWSVTEPDIGYQSSYIFALSPFVFDSGLGSSAFVWRTNVSPIMTNDRPKPIIFTSRVWSSNTSVTNVSLNLSSLGGPAVLRMSNISAGTLWRRAWTPPIGLSSGPKAIGLSALDTLGDYITSFMSETVYDMIPPNQPVIIQLSYTRATNKTNIIITWNKGVDESGISGYRIWVSTNFFTNGASWSNKGTLKTNLNIGAVTNWIDGNVKSTMRAKYYVIQSIDTSGNVSTTWKSTNKLIPLYLPPPLKVSGPLAFSFSSISNGKQNTTISWKNPVDPNRAGIYILRSSLHSIVTDQMKTENGFTHVVGDQFGDVVIVAVLGNSALNWTDTNSSFGKIYYYSVVSADSIPTYSSGVSGSCKIKALNGDLTVLGTLIDSGTSGADRTLIQFQATEDNSEITVDVISSSGEFVRRFEDKMYNKGLYQFVWDGKNDSGKDVASGVYIIRVRINGAEPKNKNGVLPKVMVIRR